MQTVLSARCPGADLLFVVVVVDGQSRFSQEARERFPAVAGCNRWPCRGTFKLNDAELSGQVQKLVTVQSANG